jgi:hypothetical protein
MYSGEIINDASLEEIIKIYVNHRPAVSQLSAADVATAFAEIRKKYAMNIYVVIRAFLIVFLATG